MNKLTFIGAFFCLISCAEVNKKDAFPNLVKLVVTDSILLDEKDYFLNGQFHVRLIQDSILGISSIKSPSIGFFSTSGRQLKRIASGDYPIGSFLPSNFDASLYPLVYLLDMKSGSILEFNVEEQIFIKKIKINFPEGKELKYVGSKLKKLEKGFLIELASSAYDNYDPNYYKKSGDLIFLLDETGNVTNKLSLTYPESIISLEGSIHPIDYLVFSSYNDSFLFSFPYTQKIQRFDNQNLKKPLEEIPIPKSRYFNFKVEGSKQVISFQEMFNSGKGLNIAIPNNHYFNSIHETDKHILIETWMNNGKPSPEYATFSHLIIYDKKEKKWSETSNPRNILDIGMLAGVVNDTLYFYEGSLMKHDEKYIKRAILKPIED